jgi:hypothetical protein
MWGDNLVTKELPAVGVRIEFIPLSFGTEFKLSVHFGYTSPSIKDYARSIDFDINQTKELIKYLSTTIEKWENNLSKI